MSVSDLALREIIRDIIREAMIEFPALRPVPSERPVMQVAVSTDSDLNAFVRTVLALADNPVLGSEMRSGAMRFQLMKDPEPGVEPKAQSGPTLPSRMNVKIITEKNLLQSSESDGKLILSSGTIITPLAKDRARALGISIERRD